MAVLNLREGQIGKLRISRLGTNLKPWTHWKFSIAQKIGYGYAVVISMGVLGITAGLVMGEYAQKQAQEQLILAHRQQVLMQDLENAVLRVRIHPQQLMTVLEEAVWFQYETSQFQTNLKQVEQILTELEHLVNSDRALADDPQTLQRVLQSYEQTLGDYADLIEQLWGKIDPLNLSTEQLPQVQQVVLSAIAQEEFTHLRVQFERDSEQLTRLAHTAHLQAQEAQQQLLRATQLRLQIIVASFVLFISLAAFLAWKTSRAIAEPLEAVTQIAQRVTQEANFDLRTPVYTQDEVGILALSLNQLIQWIRTYTQELELAKTTLEDRVQERTQQLQQTLQDLQNTQTQLIQSEKMSNLGQMVAGVAHEINNPINFIHGNLLHLEQYIQTLLEVLHYYQKHYPQSDAALESRLEESDLGFIQEDLPKILASMRMGTTRIKQIVISLRNFSRLDEAEMKEVDLHEGIENTLLLLNNQLQPSIQVIKKYTQLPLIFCYPAQLNQAFMNILSNAIDALQEKSISQPTIWITTSQPDENTILLQIKDNGNGIPPEVQAKLFDPFFTTKPVGKGTGLGLTVCYQIIEKHQGHIEVKSDLEIGTEFIISLPIYPLKNTTDEA